MNAAQTLAFAIDLHRWLEADQSTPVAERNRRDRGIGRQLDVSHDQQRLSAWWARIEPADAPSAGQRVLAVKRWMTVGLFVVGVLLGLSATSVALSYDGDYPVNLLALLGVLIGFPGVLLVVTVFGMLLRAGGWVPLTRLSGQLAVNRWLIGVLDRVSGLTLNASFGQANARGALAYWQLLTFSQWFAAGFFVGVLVMFLLLVAFTDLAFGWSTTLEIEASLVYQWASALCWPWAGLMPLAAPGLELVELSRFYRLADVGVPPQALGGWWPFVLMCVLVWGLLPRLLLLMVCRLQTRRAALGFLREHSEVTALLDRLRAQAVSTGEDVAVEETASPIPAASQAIPLMLKQAAVLAWNGASADGYADAPLALSATDTAEDIRQHLKSVDQDVQQVVILTKGWEPPLLEFLDVLRLVRAELGAAASIVVAPRGLEGQTLGEADRAIWGQSVAALGDPRTYVAALSEVQ